MLMNQVYDACWLYEYFMTTSRDKKGILQTELTLTFYTEFVNHVLEQNSSKARLFASLSASFCCKLFHAHQNAKYTHWPFSTYYVR